MNPKWDGMTDDLIPQATAWRNALVDGSHHQGQKRLRLNDGGMCCLGVLCDTLDPSRWTTFQGIWYWGPDDVFPPSKTMEVSECIASSVDEILIVPFLIVMVPSLTIVFGWL